MSVRKVPFVNGEYYHVYNRGVDNRIIFSDEDDMSRFIQSMVEFNVVEPIGSIYEKSFAEKRFGGKASKTEGEKLVNFVTYCLNPNHFHFVLEQVADNGIEKFMHKMGTGYTRYFNDKHKRSGVLFQGKYKATHIDSNEYLLYVSAYVNLNDRVHRLGGKASKSVKSRSSWREYAGGLKGEPKTGFCAKDIVLDQFNNIEGYQDFAESALESILERREDMKEMEGYLLE